MSDIYSNNLLYMSKNSIPARSWVNFTIITGFAAFASYLTAAFLPLPEKISLILAFAFGPLLMLASLGLFYVIREWKDSLTLRAAALFNVTATAIVTMMLVVQQTIFSFHDKFKTQPHDGVSDRQLSSMFSEVNSVQLGMDLAWDIFISAGTFLFAVSFWRHPALSKILSAAGMLAALLLLVFNLAFFPEPPGEAGSVDFGPFVSLWYLVLITWVLVKRKKIAEIAGSL